MENRSQAGYSDVISSPILVKRTDLLSGAASPEQEYTGQQLALVRKQDIHLTLILLS
jgi:hypothetical protein